jgi:hypothetical protein
MVEENKPLTAGSEWICTRCCWNRTEAHRRWKIKIFLTHLFNARKADLASGVPSLCGIDNRSGACYSNYWLILNTSTHRGLVLHVICVMFKLILIN